MHATSLSRCGGELTYPAASGMETNTESDIFWRCLRESQLDLEQHVLAFLEQKQYDEVSLRRKRERYRDACNAVFFKAFRGGSLRRLASVLDHPDFPWDADPESRYASLFRHHGNAELDRRRQSYLEYFGAQGRECL